MAQKKKPDKYLKTAAIMGALLLIMIAAYLIISAATRPEGVTVETAETDMMIVQQDAAQITAIAYTWQGETIDMAFSSSAYKWQLASDKAFPLTNEIPAAMATAISAVKAQRFVEDSRERFADYGLDEPYLTIAVTYTDDAGTSNDFTYNIGDYNQMAGGYYFNIGGTDEVYIIPSGLNPYFEYTLLDMATVDVLPDLTNSETFAVKKIASDADVPDDKYSAVTEQFGGLVKRGIKVCDYISGSGNSGREKYSADGYLTLKIDYTEAQNVTNEDSSITSTVHVDKSLDLWLGLASGGDSGEKTAYIGSSSGLVYTCDTDAVSAIFEILGK